MGRRPPKNPEVPKVEGAPKDAAPEGDNKGGTVRKKRGGSKGKSPQNISLAVEALEALSQAGADPVSLKKAYASAVEVYGADTFNAAMQSKGMNPAGFAPAAEVAQPSTNMVTENTVTTGSVVPVTSTDNALPSVPTAEQAAALQALGLKGGGEQQAASAAPKAQAEAFPSPRHIGALLKSGMTEAEIASTPMLDLLRRFNALGSKGNVGVKGGNAAQEAAADRMFPIQPGKLQPQAADPRRPLTIANMADMLATDALDYRQPVDVPPVMIESRTVNPEDVAGQPTVQTRTGQYQPKPPTQPFKFPAGMDFSGDDGRVQLADTDYSNMQSTVVDPQAAVQWYARQNRVDSNGNPRQSSGSTVPDKPDPFADIPVNPNQGLVWLRRNKANILNRGIPMAAAAGGMAGVTGLTIYGLSQMLKGEPAQPQPQGQDPDEAILMNSNTVGGFR